MAHHPQDDLSLLSTSEETPSGDTDPREINRQLLASEQRLRLALEAGGVGLWVWNSTDVSNAGDWSPRLKEIFGLPLEAEVTHELFLSAVHPADRAAVNEAVMQAIHGAHGGAYRMEYRATPTDGAPERWVTARGQAFFNPDGTPYRFIGTVVDITERKLAEQVLQVTNEALEERIAERTQDLARMNAELQRSKNELRLAIDTIPGFIWTATIDGQIDYINQRWLEYTGLTREQAIGSGWQQSVHPDDLPGLLDYWQKTLPNEKSGRYESRLRKHDGTYRWFLSRGVPLCDEQGRVIKWYGTKVDIQAHKNSEHLIRSHLEALTQLLTALSEEEDSEKLLEHVARMISDRTGAQMVSFWSRNDVGRLDRLATFQDDRLQFPDESASADQVAALRALGHPVWEEFFLTGTQCLEGDFSGDIPLIRIAGREGAAWQPACGREPVDPLVIEAVQKLRGANIQSTLTVPLTIASRFEGMLSIRFLRHREFHPEELELVKALARQAMITIEIMRLSRQSRETAIVAERNRLARDIHDTIAQGLTGVIVQLEAAEDARSKGLGAEADSHLTRARDLAVESLREARVSVRALRPRALATRDLCAALECIFQQMTEGTALKATFQVEGEPRPLPSDWESHLLRIGQEALTNTLRHARATRFRGHLSFASQALKLEFVDNGRGLTPAGESSGLGLLGMRERVTAMNGELTIRSAPGTGLAIAITLTLPDVPQ